MNESFHSLSKVIAFMKNINSVVDTVVLFQVTQWFRSSVKVMEIEILYLSLILRFSGLLSVALVVIVLLWILSLVFV